MKVFLGFVAKLAIFAAVAVWLASEPGSARIEWRGYDIDTSASFLLLFVFAATFIVYAVVRSWSRIAEKFRLRGLNKKLENSLRGHDMFVQGLSAIAAGNAAEAGKLAIGARKYLGDGIAAKLLQAQAAQLAGDAKAALSIFSSMSLERDGEILGCRGLIVAAMKENRWDEAERLMDRLGKSKAEIPWLNLARFEAAARRGKWNEAGAALAFAAQARLLDASLAKRHQAALFIAASEVETFKGDKEKALHKAELALKHSRDWTPAIYALAAKQFESGHKKAALRTIEKFWETAPHPHLAELYLMACGVSDNLERHKIAEKLTCRNRDNPVSQLFLAETALAADLWGEARRRLVNLASAKDCGRKVYKLLAKLERRESGDEKAAAGWLAKCADASPDAAWLCSSCGGANERWTPSCPHCAAFDSFEWQIAGKSRNDKIKAIGLGNGK